MMNYEKLNDKHKRQMNSGVTKPAHVMEWKDSDFMDNIMGKLPKVRKYRDYSEINEKISLLEKTLQTYDVFHSNKSEFLKKVSGCIIDIQTIKNDWYGLNLYEIEECLNMHSFCLISGEGGIGKSYFIKCFEDNLTKQNIKHLCMYGKFAKDVKDIDIAEIIRESANGFVFIFDAINEIDEEEQKKLVDILIELKKHQKIRIVVTYRTNSMSRKVIDKYKKLSEYEYKFPGVKFTSALSELVKWGVPNVYMYEDILYSNNPLLLGMLCSLLSDKKILQSSLNGIASITFIFEKYIKEAINNRFKKGSISNGNSIWKDTKKVTTWMYQNDKKLIDYASLMHIVKNKKDFLKAMIQMGFINIYEDKKNCYYYFSNDSLSDFLIARSVLDDIKDKEYDEYIKIIKSKIEKMSSLREALIIAIFDKMKEEYGKIKNILDDSGLIKYFTIETLLKIRFNANNIILFLNVFKLNKHFEALCLMGGYTDKPFNCSNYLFNYYCESKEKQFGLSNELINYNLNRTVKDRLKNVLYSITLNSDNEKTQDEAFYFSLLCSAFSDKDIRILAVKLLYEVISQNQKYISKAIEEYPRIYDYYIKEVIIYVLSKVSYADQLTTDFYHNLIIHDNSLSARSIRRISGYLGNDHIYINWERKNLYKYDEEERISDSMNNLLFKIDLHDKNFFPFRYWGKDNIDMRTKFLINNKKIIKKINRELASKYCCVMEECAGCLSFENALMSEVEKLADIKEMGTNSFFASFEKVL